MLACYKRSSKKLRYIERTVSHGAQCHASQATEFLE